MSVHDDEVYLTRSGYQKLERELHILETVETREMAERMAQVRGEGDVSQEQAYFDTIYDKNMLDERIARLKGLLQRAKVIDRQLDPDSVTPGDRVTLRDMDEKEEFTVDLISGVEIASGLRSGISLGSPVGKAILGKKVGDKFEVKAPDGIIRYKVLKIEAISQEDL